MFNFTGNKSTVDGVLAAFNTAVADLKNVATIQTAKAAEHAGVARAALSAAAEAEAEANRAVAVAAKMEAVFN